MPTVHDILARKEAAIHTTTPDTTVLEAIAKMESCDVGALVVVDGGEICGMITERDYLRKVILKGRSSNDTPVKTIMSSPVVVVHRTDTLDHCMNVMTKQRCRHLPVVDADDSLVGLVSVGDVIKQIAQDQRQELKFLREYMAGPAYDPDSPS